MKMGKFSWMVVIPIKMAIYVHQVPEQDEREWKVDIQHVSSKTYFFRSSQYFISKFQQSFKTSFNTRSTNWQQLDVALLLPPQKNLTLWVFVYLWNMYLYLTLWELAYLCIVYCVFVGLYLTLWVFVKNIEVYDILFYILIFFDEFFVTDLLLMKKLLFQWHQCTTGKRMLPFENH